VVLNKEWLLERAGQLIDEANRQLGVLSRIVYCEDNLTSFKAAGALYALAVAANWFSPGALAVMRTLRIRPRPRQCRSEADGCHIHLLHRRLTLAVLVSVFVLPILYLKFHPAVDKVLNTAEEHATRLLQTYAARTPDAPYCLLASSHHVESIGAIAMICMQCDGKGQAVAPARAIPQDQVGLSEPRHPR